ncbi:unnamed protein product [Ostreobium quekettii]|uniref:Uncharacterized protein n=1 Tax=Ostreobium quekettii TaxID=121088 RepID=A0A8S1IY11_9CHLO|nr:unnamed protein product [Ostreobium quekettii]
MDVHLAVIKDAVEAAKDYLLEARYHKNMLRFLCCEMEKVADLLPQLPKDASQEFLVVLKDEMEKGSLLISRHGRRFDLRGFYKVCRQANPGYREKGTGGAGG